MWHAADIADKIRHAKGYQFKGPGIGEPQFDWQTFKPQRDAYIKRLNGIYDNNVTKEGVDYHHEGRVNLDKLDPQRLFLAEPAAEYYVCGPFGFMTDVRDYLVAKGVDPTRVHMEVFGTGDE